MFTRKDLLSTLVTGFTAGIIAWQVLNFIEAPSFGLPGPHPHSLFVIIIPILWIVGVKLGYFLSRWIPPFAQFGKFAAIGFTNFAVDTGVLNLFIAITGIAAGWEFSVFKSISFLAGVIHSYIWNRFWAFESSSQDRRQEFIKFFSVAVVAILINVGVASFVVNGLDPAFGLDEKAWANVGSVVGSGVALIFSFVGFRLVVFKKS
jgi:putative flippase GtrA